MPRCFYHPKRSESDTGLGPTAGGLRLKLYLIRLVSGQSARPMPSFFQKYS